MEPMTAMAVMGGIKGLSSILGGIFGGSAASAEAESAMRILNDSIARINALQIPDVTKKIIYDQYMSVGDFTPKMLDKVIEENAPLALLQEDPKYKAKMEATLARQEQLTKGPSAQFELGLEQARRKTAQDVLAQMASIESAAKRTGTFSAGATLASKLKAAQAGADRQAMEGLAAASQAEQLQSQNLENFIRSLSAENARSMEVQSSNVQARNLRDELLMKNAMAREQANKQAMNQAALRNLEERQKAFDANIGVNIGEQRRVGYEAPMKMYQMQLDRANALNQMYGKMADVHTGRGAAKAQMWSNIGSGFGDIAAGGFGAYQMAQNPAAWKSLYGSEKATGGFDANAPFTPTGFDYKPTIFK